VLASTVPVADSTAVAPAAAAVPSGRTGRRLPVALRSLAHRDYRLWAAADVVSTIGSWMQLVAQNWIVLQLTHSPAALGGTVAIQSAPAVVLGMWGGDLADRFPKRRLLIVTQTMFAVLAALLAVATAFDVLTIWLVWGAALATGLTTAVNTPAVGSFCTELVPPEDLGNAMALGSATSSTGRMLGMGLAGWVVAGYGAQTAFALNGLSFLAVILALSMMRAGRAAAGRSTSGSDGAWQGLMYLFRTRTLLGLLALCFCLSAFGRNFQVTMAAMADGPLHGGARTYGTLSTVFAAGTVVGAVVAARCRRLDVRVLFVAAASAALLQMWSAFAPNTVGFAATMAPIAVAAVVVDTTCAYLVQTRSSAAFRGRAIAGAAVVSAAAGAFGSSVLGVLSSSFGPRAALFVGGGVALAATTGAAWALRGRIAVLRPCPARS
jgi:predicted MFS family arabinose efflux permease